MSEVIVVPETEDFHLDVSHSGVIWITKKLGVPDLEAHNALYVAPYWLAEGEGVNRVFHIRSVSDQAEATEIELGNSFVVSQPWKDMGQHRRFEYHSLSTFGLHEIGPGLLIEVPGTHAA